MLSSENQKTFLFVCLFEFLAASGLFLHGLFSNCGEQGLLFVAVHGLLVALASLVVQHRL